MELLTHRCVPSGDARASTSAWVAATRVTRVGGGAALAHVVLDVVPLAARVVDVVLGLVEGAEDTGGRRDERVSASLVARELLCVS